MKKIEKGVATTFQLFGHPCRQCMYVCVCEYLVESLFEQRNQKDGDSLSSTSHSRAVGQPQTEANSMGLNNNIVYVHHQCVCNIQKDQPTERKRYFPSTVWNCNNFSVGGGQCSTFSRTFGGGRSPEKSSNAYTKKKKKTYFFLKKEKKKRKIYSD